MPRSAQKCPRPELFKLTAYKTAGQRDHVLAAQANAYFNEGRYFQAAQCYAQCSVTFEEVALKFLDAGERDSLRSYLISRLERTRKGVRSTSLCPLLSD